ncbi:hypothetical protein M9H77_22394 [Catharanthus roseus]|uniref:Uncharacterized protein n=1 Tax=Catharanthus roseus TaxID=4058 RepID=A0ACC0AQR9_CATRO|nr:hypothetical protein M9H77_22394 [Catharanthus roseus]
MDNNFIFSTLLKLYLEKKQYVEFNSSSCDIPRGDEYHGNVANYISCVLGIEDKEWSKEEELSTRIIQGNNLMVKMAKYGRKGTLPPTIALLLSLPEQKETSVEELEASNIKIEEILGPIVVTPTVRDRVQDEEGVSFSFNFLLVYQFPVLKFIKVPLEERSIEGVGLQSSLTEFIQCGTYYLSSKMSSDEEQNRNNNEGPSVRIMQEVVATLRFLQQQIGNIVRN